MNNLLEWEIIAKDRKEITIFKNLLQNQHKANFSQTWYKSYLDEGNSSMLK
jgi:hypothetical protein